MSEDQALTLARVFQEHLNYVDLEIHKVEPHLLVYPGVPPKRLAYTDLPYPLARELHQAIQNRGQLWPAHMDLRGMALFHMDLQEFSFEGADLRGVSLYGSNLKYASFEGADLRRASLDGSRVHLTKFGKARLAGTQLPSAPEMLLAQWGVVSDPLCLELMRYDCANLPSGERLFERWKRTGHCPFHSARYRRAAHFAEKRRLWSPGPALPAWTLLKKLLRAKCNMRKAD